MVGNKDRVGGGTRPPLSPKIEEMDPDTPLPQPVLAPEGIQTSVTTTNTLPISATASASATAWIDVSGRDTVLVDLGHVGSGYGSPAAHGRRDLSEQDLDKAEDFYGRLKAGLETEHFDRYVAIDVEDGRHVVADTRLEAQAAHTKTYGEDRYSCTFHIGTTR